MFKPVMNRLVELLEVMARAKGAGGLEGDPHVRELLESINSRLGLLEDRQDFTDRLLEARLAPPKEVSSSAPSRSEEHRQREHGPPVE